MIELDKVKGFLVFKILLKFTFEGNGSLFLIKSLLGTIWDWVFKEDGLTIWDCPLLFCPVLLDCPILLDCPVLLDCPPLLILFDLD